MVFAPLSCDLLGRSKRLLINDPQMREHLRTALTAPQNTDVGNVLDHAANTGRVPVVAGTVFHIQAV